MKGRRGVTLVELLAVIAIIAIIVALLFPVFLSAKRKAKQTSCMNSMRQVALASDLYTADNDDTFPALTNAYSAYNQYPARTKNFSWMLATYAYSKSANVYYCPEAINNDRVFDFDLNAVNLELPERHFGINEFLSPDSTDASYQGAIPTTAIGNTSMVPLIADSAYVEFDNPDYIILANYNSPALDANSSAFELDPNLTADRSDPKYARHSGGANLIFADFHAKWLDQRAMGLDPSRSTYPYAQSFLLPVDPNDNRVQ